MTPTALHRRVRRGLAERGNWFQLVRFCLVGASGYVVNLVTFAIAFSALGMHHLAAAAAAFVLAVTNNFWWNRQWTFRACDGHLTSQAARFLIVNLSAFAIAASALHALVDVFGVPAVTAQAISIVVATPFNFMAHRFWSFAPTGERTESGWLNARLAGMEGVSSNDGPSAEVVVAPACRDTSAGAQRGHGNEFRGHDPRRTEG